MSYRESHVAEPRDASVADATLGALLRHAVGVVPQRIALKEPWAGEGVSVKQWTYAALLREAEQCAQALLTLFAPGDRIAVWANSQPEYVVLEFGVALAGMTLVPVNHYMRGADLGYAVGRIDAKGLFIDASGMGMDNRAEIERLRPELPALAHVFAFEDWDAFMARGEGRAAPLPAVEPRDPFLISWTSGTTGKPKGVVLLHRGAVANATLCANRYALDPHSVWLNVLPMFHMGGTISITLGCLSNLGTQVIHRGFNPEALLRSMEHDRGGFTILAPSMLQATFAHPACDATDVSSMQVVMIGGASAPPALIAETKRRLGADVVVGFGQTESGGVFAQTHRGDTDDTIARCVGTAIPGYAVKIIHPESGEVRSVGVVGEVCVRGDCLMRGYDGQPDRTAEAIDAEGWLHTGDLGEMDERGYFRIVGRLNDMILRAGQPIYPREIEDALTGDPTLAEIAVFGIPDSRQGEQVVAAVRLAANATLDAERLAGVLDSRIGPGKAPGHWVVVDRIPLNASGKVQRFVLRETYSHLSRVD